MVHVEIFMWWLDIDLKSKEWLRENLRATELPLEVLQRIADVGGPRLEELAGGLSDADWDFIETQSEFVD
ncbi:hypothetical protein AHiyo8_36110 [Arthrobacter sp. Hiyo8]|uniref:Uncharacterized protein n=1 Tax=Arthrobacter gyeryongensis TaxID=1650592 RepID=A0ABP9S431_9MICC|nr:hypothetical protein AHiyo8_36110 [Arthrobacter sp. Hiyo8]GAP59443.1 hypothetical protein AHiyo1_27450 [Arthrobacter sp. Hiyo1]